MWERACSRIRFNIQHGCRLIHRFREQARSHRVNHCQKDLLMLATTVALHTSSKPQLLVHWLFDKSVSM